MLLPGIQDPCNSFLPQQPFHGCLFGKSSKLSTLQLVTNPVRFDTEGINVLGTSGQNLNDMYKYIESENRMEMAENMLNWAHIAPTAPDTLACHPYKDKDPFIINSRPHIYFVGNQSKLETKLVQGNFFRVRYFKFLSSNIFHSWG